MLSYAHFHPEDEQNLYQPPLHLHRPPAGHGPRAQLPRFVKAVGSYDDAGRPIVQPEAEREDIAPKSLEYAGLQFWKDLDLTAGLHDERGSTESSLKTPQSTDGLLTYTPVSRKFLSGRDRQRSVASITKFAPAAPVVGIPKSQWFIRRALLAKCKPLEDPADPSITSVSTSASMAVSTVPLIPTSSLASLIDLPPPPPPLLPHNSSSSASTPLTHPARFVPPAYFHLNERNVGYRMLVRNGWDGRGGLGRAEGIRSSPEGQAEDFQSRSAGRLGGSDIMLGEARVTVKEEVGGAIGNEVVPMKEEANVNKEKDSMDREGNRASPLRLASGSRHNYRTSRRIYREAPSTRSVSDSTPTVGPAGAIRRKPTGALEENEDEDIQCIGGYDGRIDLTLEDSEAEEDAKRAMRAGDGFEGDELGYPAGGVDPADTSCTRPSDRPGRRLSDGSMLGTSETIDEDPPNRQAGHGPGRTAPIPTALKLDLSGIGHRPPTRSHPRPANAHSSNNRVSTNPRRVTHTSLEIRDIKSGRSSAQDGRGPVSVKAGKKAKEREREERAKWREMMDF